MKKSGKTYGRIDWMPRRRVWRVVWYAGAKDVPIGEYHTQEEATQALITKVQEATIRYHKLQQD